MLAESFSHYQILTKIGEGGMGEVFLAEDTSLDRKVALKFLPEELQQDEIARKRFLREAKSAAALDHPYICNIHEVGEVDGKGFISMEYVEGETLGNLLLDGPLSINNALSIATEIAEALEKAHRAHIVHRDLKPSNIMRTPDGHVKVMDFGLAKRIASEDGDSQERTLTTLTEEGSTLGTLPYMSPEQLRGEEVDTRSDIFSFGVLLYEMLAGVHPFLKGQLMETAGAILKEDPPPLARYREEVPQMLHHTVRKMLAKEPGRRYQSVREIHTNLMELQHDPPGPAVGATASTGSGLPDRTVAWKYLALLLAVTLAIAVGALWWPGRTLPSPSARLMMNLPGFEATTWWRGGMTLSPNGRVLVYVAVDGASTQLRLRRRNSFVVEPLLDTQGASFPFFRPDGEWIGFFADGELRKVSLAGGSALTICEAKGYGASWGDDDTIVFSTGFGQGLARVSATGGRPILLTDPTEEPNVFGHYWPQILPGSSQVLYTMQPEAVDRGHKIGLVSLETGEQRVLIENGTSARYSPSGHLIFVQRGTLVAAPFELGRWAVTGAPSQVVSSLALSGDGQGLFDVSDDGALAYLPAEARPAAELIWVDRKGQQELIKAPRFDYRGLSLSPDGKRLAVTVSEPDGLQVRLLDLNRGTLSSSTFDGINHLPVWSPDGRRIAFTSDREGRANLFWKRADASRSAEAIAEGENHQDAASFSPDGTILAFAEIDPETKYDIWLARLDGQRRVEPFLKTKSEELRPMISPDGRWLAYVSNESGNREVFLQAFSGGDERWQISTGGGGCPLWSPDGRELFYWKDGTLLAVPINTTGDLHIGSQNALFELKVRLGIGFGRCGYDVTPEGRFVMMRPFRDESATLQLHFIFNWTAGLDE